MCLTLLLDEESDDLEELNGDVVLITFNGLEEESIGAKALLSGFLALLSGDLSITVHVSLVVFSESSSDNSSIGHHLVGELTEVKELVE